MNRCLPRASTEVTVAPIMRSGRGPGGRTRAAVTVRPTRCGRRPAAVRRRVSPSGTASPAADGLSDATSAGARSPAPAGAGAPGIARSAPAAGTSTTFRPQHEAPVALD